MSNFNEQLPQWDNTGLEPSTQKKTDGWGAGEKPPAGWMNWLFNRAYKCIQEIRNFVDGLAGEGRTTETVKGNADAIASHQAKYENEILNTVNSQQILLANSSPVYNFTAKRAGGIDVLLNGEMVVNLLGRDGDCESTSGNMWVATNCTIALDTTNKVFSNNAIKMTASMDLAISSRLNIKSKLDSSKYYLLSGYTKNNNLTNGIYIKFVAGSTTLNSSSINTTQNYVRSGIKISPSDLVDLSTGYFYVYSDSATTGQYGYLDGLMLIKITQDEYNNLTVDQLLEKYPYVNSAQPLQNTAYEVYGKNLFNFRNLRPQNTTYTSLKFLEDGIIIDEIAETNGIFANAIRIPVKANTTYTYSHVATGDILNCSTYIYDGGIGVNAGERGTPLVGSSDAVFTFTTLTSGCIWIGHNLVSSHTIHKPITIKNIQLEEGTVATTYEPYKGGQIIFPTQLAKIGMYQDKLEYEDGKAILTRNVKKTVLGGDWAWNFSIDKTGSKVVQILSQLSGYAIAFGNSIIIKYDGKIVQQVPTTNEMTTGDMGYAYNNVVKLCLNDTDSGWGESYTPTANEIKAYFYGWKMYVSGSGRSTLYEGTGTKAWVKITRAKDSDALDTSEYTTVLPTTLAGTDTKGNVYTPYQLYYALATPIEEEIQPIILGDGFDVVEGINTIVAKSGYMYEKVTIANGIGGNINYKAINVYNYPGGYDKDSKLTYRTRNVSKIFKKKHNKIIDDTNNWLINSTSQYGYGGAFVYTTVDKYDLTAEYYVLYEALPEEYNCQVQTPTITIAENFKNSYENTVVRLGNVEKDLSLQQVKINEFTSNLKEKETYAYISMTANQSIPNNAGTSLIWQSVDGQGICALDISTNKIKILETGVFDISIVVAFVGNATGTRRLGGSGYIGAVSAFPTTTDSCYLQLNGFAKINAGTLLDFTVFQNSGSPLDISGPGGNTYCRIRSVAKL